MSQSFSVMSGRNHRFLGITSTFGEVNVRIELPTYRSGVRRSTTRPPCLPKEKMCLRWFTCRYDLATVTTSNFSSYMISDDITLYVAKVSSSHFATLICVCKLACTASKE